MSGGKERRVVSQAAIAIEAGVARTTVSLALRGGEGLMPETVERVMEAARRLGYRPNKLVQAIRSGHTRMIGVMVPPVDTFWADLVHGVHDSLVEADFVPMTLWPRHRTPDPDDSYQVRQLQRLTDWRVDGAILWPKFARMHERYHADFARRIPLVTVDVVLPAAMGADAVLSDEALGAARIVDHLAELGHRSILHFRGPESETWAAERCRHLLEEAGRLGIEVAVAELPLVPPRHEFVREALRQHPRASAAVCATDGMADDVLEVARELGWRIPADFSLIGHGAVDFGARLSPPLTTIRQRPYRMGRAAVRLVLERLSAPEPPPPRIERLPVELVIRGSTGPAGLRG